MIKYKVFGFSLVIFISLLLFLWLKPSSGLENIFSIEKRIDIIQIVNYHDLSLKTITKKNDLHRIRTEIHASTQYEPIAIKSGKETFEVHFYGNGKSFISGF